MIGIKTAEAGLINLEKFALANTQEIRWLLACYTIRSLRNLSKVLNFMFLVV